MRKIKNIVVAAAITAMAFSITGCKMIEKTPEAIQKTVLAKVGNDKITMGDVNSELQADIDYLIETYGENYENTIDDNLKEQLKKARTQVLDQLVNNKVLITKGTEFGYIPTGDALTTAIEEEKEKFKEAYGGEDGLKQALEYSGISEEKFNSNIENLVKVNKVIDAITKDVTVSDEEVEKYSRIVTLDEIKENDYNLNISRYIDTTEEEEQIDVVQAIKELKQLEQERNEIEATMYSFLKELGYCE